MPNHIVELTNINLQQCTDNGMHSCNPQPHDKALVLAMTIPCRLSTPGRPYGHMLYLHSVRYLIVILPTPPQHERHPQRTKCITGTYNSLLTSPSFPPLERQHKACLEGSARSQPLSRSDPCLDPLIKNFRFYVCSSRDAMWTKKKIY